MKNPNKPDIQTIFASIITFFMMIPMVITWVISLIGMILILPKDQWIIPWKDEYLKFYKYDNWYCKYLCYITETTVHQTHTIRHRVGAYYCHETLLNNDLKEDFPDTKE